MLPAKRAPCNPGSFFGKSYPRAVGRIDEENRLIRSVNAELPNEPFLQWAKKVDWSQGGTAARPAGKVPKAPVTALEAYTQYLRSQAQRDILSHAPDGEEHHTSVALLKQEAAHQAEENWESLSEAEKRIFDNIAKEDAMRFQVEAVAHELRNPGWFKTWLAHKGTSGKAADGGRVKPPMTPWMAFVHVILTKLKEQDPILAASVSKLELMRLAMKEASPLYKKLSEDEKAGYVKLAEEDKARYEKELQENPEAQRRLEKAKKRAAVAKAGKTKITVKRPRKPAAAKEPEEADAEVDTVGLTTMQAWAARRAAKRAGEKKKAAVTHKTAAVPGKRTVTRGAASKAREEVAQEAAEDADVEDTIQATPAELPDQAFIRTQATGEDWETESSSGEESSEAESDADDAADSDADGQGEPSVIADTIGSLEDAPMTQDNADSGVLGKVQGLVTAGIKWLTTGRKRRGVMSSMQAEGFKAPTPRKLEAEYGDRRASKRRRQ